MESQDSGGMKVAKFDAEWWSTYNELRSRPNAELGFDVQDSRWCKVVHSSARYKEVHGTGWCNVVTAVQGTR